LAVADPQNILVIHFGQLGDVVLATPAFRAIRECFADSKITILSGRSTYGVVRLIGASDEQIGVDRVALRDGNKAKSIKDILSLVKEVRGHNFDLVIDLHSLYETNLLGYFSGAKQRLFSNRDRRSIDRLSNFPIKPPKEDRTLHHTDRYLGVLEALDVRDVERKVEIMPPRDAADAARNFLSERCIADDRLIGFFLGAGHHSRRWPVENFVEAATALSASGQTRVLIFLGPEERELRSGLDGKFGDAAIVVPEFPVDVFVAVLSHVDVLVSGDTGPMHLGAAAGAGIVLLSQKGAPDIFRPLTERLVVLDERDFDEIDVEIVVDSVRKLLS
jgi:ADP-heptose:LPS heptosyltransferase